MQTEVAAKSCVKHKNDIEGFFQESFETSEML